MAAEAPARPLPGNSPLSLRQEAGSVWRVTQGAVDLFSVDVVDGRPEGPRRHVLRLATDAFLIAPDAQVWPSQLDVLAIGTVDAQLQPLPAHALCGDATSVGRWADTLGRAVLDGTSESIGALRSALAAASPSAATDEGACAEPATPPMAWRGALEAMHAEVLARLALTRLDARQLDAARLKVRGGADTDQFCRAIARLGEVLEPETPGVESERETVDEPLVAACRLVCEAQGIDAALLDTPPPAAQQAAAAALADPVATVARHWHLRVRQVLLTEQWFLGDCGPLVAFLEDGGPVALLPASPRRYQMVAPPSGARQRVDEAVVQGLRPHAYTFYRPLPRGALRWTDLLRFSLRGGRLDVATVVVTLVVGGLLGMVVPIVTGVIVGTVIPGADRSMLWQLVLGVLWTSVALAVLSLVQSVALNRMEQIMEAPLQAAVWDRLLDLPVSFFRRYSAGDLASRVMGVSTLRRALTGAALTSILGLVMSFFNLCLLFWYDVWMAVAALGLLAVQTIVFLLALRLQVRRQRRVSEVQGQLSGLLLQLFSGISKLRVAGAESRAFGVWARRFARQSALAYDARRVATATAAFDAAFGIVTSVLVYAVVAFGHVTLSTGAFISFTSALGSFLAAFLALNGALASVIAAIPAYERSLPILEAVPEVEPTRARAPLLRGDVDLSHVTFRYTAEGQGREEREEGPLILSDVSIRARSGQFIAIVGPSGAGKSTVFRLLLGFETPQSGSVTLDGESLEYLDVQAVRSQIGVVLQSGRLMSGDIFHNIVGARALTLDDAWRAAEMAGIADEIRAMPMGMNTVVSEGAGNLSGGQRQRLLIARAVAGSPKILLFDEATSALDNYTQARVSEAIRRLPATRIVIAHRLSTVQDADCIYVLKDARVAESGTFDELMAARGAFWELVSRQLT